MRLFVKVYQFRPKYQCFLSQYYQARPWLASEIRGNWASSGWYGRRLNTIVFYLCHIKRLTGSSLISGILILKFYAEF